MSAVSAGIVGAYSHVFLDSLMHRDIEPFSPWSVQNPLYGVVNVITLHALCILLGLFGAWYISQKSAK